LALCLLLTACGGGGGTQAGTDSTRVDSVARPQATLDLPCNRPRLPRQAANGSSSAAA
jgi:hypothetical protein